MPGDRSRLDNRRLGAVLVDCLVFTPIWLVATQYDFGAEVMATALFLAYFYVCDTTGGQTIGKSLFKLRTVTLDGQIVGLKAAGGRTVLRLIDHTPIGLILMRASGPKRQRLGDRLARTCVVDAREVDVELPLTAAHLAYPAVWIAPALVAFFLSADGRLAGTYRADADAICANANTLFKQAKQPMDVLVIHSEQMRQLGLLTPPRNWEARHETLMAEGGALLTSLQALRVRVAQSDHPERSLKRGWTRLMAQAKASNARLRAAGFEDCGSDG